MSETMTAVEKLKDTTLAEVVTLAQKALTEPLSDFAAANVGEIYRVARAAVAVPGGSMSFETVRITTTQAKALLAAIEGYAEDQGVPLDVFLANSPDLAAAVAALSAPVPR